MKGFFDDVLTAIPRGCETCPLDGKKIIRGHGRSSAKMMVLAEAPGKNEEQKEKNLIGGAGKVFMKMIVVESTDIVVGCHMVGEHAGEIIQGIAVAMKAGAKKADFDATIGIHPTAAEEFVTMR